MRDRTNSTAKMTMPSKNASYNWEGWRGMLPAAPPELAVHEVRAPTEKKADRSGNASKIRQRQVRDMRKASCDNAAH